MLQQRFECAHCGQPIGVYEPALWHTADGRAHEGSPLSVRTRDPQAVQSVMHRSCVLEPAQASAA